ncbi:MAG: preprotein translocase subunit SecG [Nitrospirota bacterium]
MYTFLIVLHIIVSFALIFIVLLQRGKGADVGAAFGGGSSHTIFGSRGATSLLSKITTVAAIIFMLTSLSLAVMSSKRGSIVSKEKTEAPISQPVEQKGPVTPKADTAPETQSGAVPQGPQKSPQESTPLKK